MATIHVALSGNDNNSGSSFATAKRNIKPAVASAPIDSTVLVYGDDNGAAYSGVDNRAIVPRTRVAVEGYIGPGGDEPRPIIDGDYLSTGFFTDSGPSGTTIKNFEIRRCRGSGIRIYGPAGGTPRGVAQHNGLIENNHIHHCLSPPEGPSTIYAYGVYVLYGNWTIRNNEIHHINGFNESTGVWTGFCKNHVVERNTIYSVRKEGIRSSNSLNGTFDSNYLHHVWFGLEPNNDAGGLWTNNVVHNSTCGANPKHANDPSPGRVFAYWGITENFELEPWTRFWHNTFHRCSWALNVMAINGFADGTGKTWYTDQRNNIYSGRSAVGVWDSPGWRGDGWIHDYNLYSTANDGPSTGTYFAPYMTQYVANQNSKTLEQMRADLGIDIHSFAADPQFNDMLAGDFDYDSSSPAWNAGVDLTPEGSPYGRQMGALGVHPHRNVTAHAYEMTLVSSNRSGNPGASAMDENLLSGTVTPIATPFEMVADLGSSRTINHIFGDNLQNAVPQNPRRVALDTGPSATGPWTEVVDFNIYDSGGTSWKEEIDPAVTTRYVRWRILSNWSSTGLTGNVAVSDLKLSFIDDPGSTPPPPDTTAPVITIDEPADAASVAGDVEIVTTATDDVAVARVEFYVDGATIGAISSPPYSLVWPTTVANAGARVITARAFDPSGNSTLSAAVDVTVTTTTGGPPDPDPPVEPTTEAFWGILLNP